MGERKIRGEAVSDEQLQAWADEAEAGYDPSQLARRHRADRRRWRRADRWIAAGAAAALAAYALTLLVTAYHGDALCAVDGRYAESDPDYVARLSMLPAGYTCVWVDQPGSPAQLVGVSGMPTLSVVAALLGAALLAALVVRRVTDARR